jgi:outer membrane receptor protein involved in Fe transport
MTHLGHGLDSSASNARLATLVGLVLFMSIPHITAAQTGPSATTPNEAVLEEVVVSATRRGEVSLQSVASAISVVDATKLDAVGLGSLQEFTQVLPSVSVQDNGPGNNIIAMRGLGVFGLNLTDATERPLVAIYLDDIPISLQSANPDLQVFDLERVEVLRGPQGTLYGAGAMSGAIRYITTKPDLQAFGGSGDASVSETEHGGTNYSTRGVVNLPIVDGSLGIRLTGFRNDNSGYIDNIGTHVANANGNSTTQGRAALRWIPTSALTIDASVTLYNLVSHGNNTVYPELGEYVYKSPIPERFDDAFRLYTLTADWQSGVGQFISSTSYMTRYFSQQTNCTVLDGFVTPGFSPPCNQIVTNDIHNFSEEVRWVSPSDQKLQTTIGAFFEHLTRFYPQSDIANGLDPIFGKLYNIPDFSSQTFYDTPSAGELFYGTIDIVERQFALFGEATYPITPKLDLTLGARYFNFRETFDLHFTGIAGAIAPGQPLTQTGAETPSGVNPRLVVSYKPTKSVMFYSEAARGFRYGGVNEPVPLAYCGNQLAAIGLTAAPVTFGPDHVWSYSLGEKGTFADGRARLNLTAFYIDWYDVQTLKSLTCGYYFAENAGHVTSRGVELESEMRVTDKLTLGVNGSYTDATAATAIPNLSAVVGDRVPYFPRAIINTHGSYKIVAGEGYVDFSADWTYRSNAFMAFSSSDFFYREIPPSSLVNASITYGRSRWAFALYGTNLTNNRLVNSVGANAYGNYQPGDSQFIGRPRTIGLRGHVSF